MKPKVTLITHEQGIFLEMGKDLVQELNKQNNTYKRNIDFYVANFGATDIPDIQNKEHFNILFLGSRKDIDIGKVKKFDKVFSSTVDLQKLLENLNIKNSFVPISWTRKGKIADINTQKQWLFIGDNEETERKLLDLGIEYRKFHSFKDSNAILNELDKAKGLIIENPVYTEDSIDFSPLILEALARKLPILTNNLMLSFYFNDVILYYYIEKIEALLDKPAPIDNAYKFYLSSYSSSAVAKKILQNINIIEEKKSNIISLKHSTFAGLYNNGDYWLANDLVLSLQKKGQTIHTYFNNSVIKNMGNVNIIITGGDPILEPKNDRDISILYVLYSEKPLNNTSDTLQKFMDVDAVAITSKKLYNELQQLGIKGYYVPQFTNTQKFYPDYDEKLKSDILFIGNHYITRKAPEIALKYKFPITIYGEGWDDNAVNTYIDNCILRKYYSSAKINLNDHREAMRFNGFINNRTFDVTASGGFLISDYIPEIEEIYGDSIPMWKTEEELVALLEYYLNSEHEAERLEKAARAREITLKNFTNDIVAQKLIDIINEVKKEKGL